MKYIATLILFILVFQVSFAQSPVEKIKELGIELQPVTKPVGNYAKFVKTGNLIFIAGHGSCGTPTEVDRGKLGQDLTTDQGYQAARNVALCLLNTINAAVDGDLSKVKRIVRVFGMVNSTPDFTEQHLVMNGCSDLLVEIFGEEKGKHARAAVGMGSLPVNLAVEVEMIIEIEE
ncbi:MAG: RidA family protein [bacterium]|nr:RidA family protein [bacterium]